MKEFLKRIKADVILSSVVCILLGVLLIIKAETAVGLVCRAIALSLMVFGAAYLITFLISRFVRMVSLIAGLAMIVFGIWFWVQPEILASFIPCVIGVIILIHGVSSLRIALETKENDYDKWWGVLLAALITVVLGIMIIVFAFTITKVVVQLLGVALIFVSVSNFWVVSRASTAAKAKRQEDEAIDTEGKVL